MTEVQEKEKKDERAFKSAQPSLDYRRMDGGDGRRRPVWCCFPPQRMVGSVRPPALVMN